MESAKMGDSPEESSWTFYIEGFTCENGDRNSSCFSSEYETPSLISDAGFNSAIKKLGFPNINSPGKSIARPLICKQNSFKKQKTRAIPTAVDIELEDTASSPVNSPKVSYMNQKEKNKIDDASEVKRNYFGKGGDFTVDQRDTIDYTDLKKMTSG